ncbi:MAG: hypothetical protein M3N47_10585 [Chloroflexota bacterium]|nr:hypothetical protein [Chloroflexota bacterium]
MRRWQLTTLGAVLLLLGLLCFAAGSFVRIIICDYPGCESGRTQTMLTYYAVGALLGVVGGYVLLRGKRHKGH